MPFSPHFSSSYWLSFGTINQNNSVIYNFLMEDRIIVDEKQQQKKAINTHFIWV